MPLTLAAVHGTVKEKKRKKKKSNIMMKLAQKRFNLKMANFFTEKSEYHCLLSYDDFKENHRVLCL